MNSYITWIELNCLYKSLKYDQYALIGFDISFVAFQWNIYDPPRFKQYTISAKSCVELEANTNYIKFTCYQLSNIGVLQVWQIFGPLLTPSPLLLTINGLSHLTAQAFFKACPAPSLLHKALCTLNSWPYCSLDPLLMLICPLVRPKHTAPRSKTNSSPPSKNSNLQRCYHIGWQRVSSLVYISRSVLYAESTGLHWPMCLAEELQQVQNSY